jgi:hypothetical protein
LAPEIAPPMTRRVFAPVGECIYCGSKDDLTKEHIIAYGLNGNAILPKSSCKKCAKITGTDIEQKFMRGQARAVRAALGFQTGRKKEVPSTFPVVLHKCGKRQRVEVPLSDFPPILLLPVFPAPGFMRGQHGVGITSQETVAISLRENTSPTEVLQEIGRRYGADGIAIDRVDHQAFARLIAKSAYALAVAEYGLANIKEKYVVPAILGKADDLGTWVGSSPQPLAPEQGEHITQVQTWKNPTTGQEIICVLIKLFAYFPAPGYLVIPASRK